MKSLIFSILFVFHCAYIFAQPNLIPNPSFEEFKNSPFNTICVQGIDSLSAYWFTPNKFVPITSINYGLLGEADLYSECISNNNTGVPLNNCGYQYPKTDSSYAGICLKCVGQNYILDTIYDLRLYIEVELKSPLSAGRKYCFEMFYCGALDRYFYDMPYKPMPLQVLFSDTIVYFKDSEIYLPGGLGHLSYPPQISQYTPQQWDTVNWIKYEDTYTAQGGERYIVIGNFEPLFSEYVGNYVYIDDVSLTYCGPDTTEVPVLDTLVIPNVFTPNGDGINEVFEYSNQEQWDFETQVFNRWGGVVYDNASSQNWDGRYKGELVSEGVYFYVIKARAKTTGEERRYRGTVSVFYN